MLKMKHHTSGSLIITALFIIVVVGMFSSLIMYMAGSHLHTQTNISNSTYAFNEAQLGLSRAVDAFVNNDTDCNDIHYTTSQYEVIGVETNASSNLQNITEEEICVESTTDFNPEGGILKINNEYIAYKTISDNCFQNLVRGLKNTTEESHADGSTVLQNQCRIESTGAVPSRTDVDAEAVLEAYYVQADYSGEAKALGKDKDNILSLALLSDIWSQYCQGSACRFFNNKEMYSTACVYDEDNQLYCTSVGKNGSSLRYQYQGSDFEWDTVNTGVSRDLMGASCVLLRNNRIFCYAVGENGTIRRIRDNQSSWKNFKSKSSYGDLADISCSVIPNSNNYNCVGVGKSGLVIQSKGSGKWKDTNLSTGGKDLTSVSCVYSSNRHRCLVVGESGTTMRSNNVGDPGIGTWFDPTAGSSSEDFISVSCIALGTAPCWAITDKKVFELSGNRWVSVYDNDVSGGGEDLYDISCQYNEADTQTYCVVVGDKSRAVFYDGSTWSSKLVDEGNRDDLYSVSLNFSEGSSFQFFLWRQN